MQRAWSRKGGALVLEFDFAKTAGYAVGGASAAMSNCRTTSRSRFWMRGEAGQNHFEVKFVDASGDNVWWYRRANYNFSGEWQNIRIKRRQIEFAWGPTSDKVLRRFARSSSSSARELQGGRAICGSIGWR